MPLSGLGPRRRTHASQVLLERVDDAYTREGTANTFAAIEPITGRAFVEVADYRTPIDLARFVERLSDEVYASAQIIVLVMDDLNTRSNAWRRKSEPGSDFRTVAREKVSQAQTFERSWAREVSQAQTFERWHVKK